MVPGDPDAIGCRSNWRTTWASAAGVVGTAAMGAAVHASVQPHECHCRSPSRRCLRSFCETLTTGSDAYDARREGLTQFINSTGHSDAHEAATKRPESTKKRGGDHRNRCDSLPSGEVPESGRSDRTANAGSMSCGPWVQIPPSPPVIPKGSRDSPSPWGSDCCRFPAISGSTPDFCVSAQKLCRFMR